MLRATIFLGSIIVALAGCGSSEQNPPVAAPETVTVTAPQAPSVGPERRCVVLWDARRNYILRILAAGVYESVVTAKGKTRYVSVGFSADFPDRCLITFASPDRGEAVQFLQSTAAFTFQGQTYDGRYRGNYKTVGNDVISIGSLDSSVTQWNARAGSHARIRLGTDGPVDNRSGCPGETFTLCAS